MKQHKIPKEIKGEMTGLTFKVQHIFIINLLSEACMESKMIKQGFISFTT